MQLVPSWSGPFAKVFKDCCGSPRFQCTTDFRRLSEACQCSQYPLQPLPCPNVDPTILLQHPCSTLTVPYTASMQCPSIAALKDELKLFAQLMKFPI